MEEISFRRRIRTSGEAWSKFPVFIETVECAIDYVQELPIEILRRPHWDAARTALWASSDNPKSTSLMEAAERALREALSKEGWLNDLKGMTQ